jgi:hypothetical protein
VSCLDGSAAVSAGVALLGAAAGLGLVSAMQGGAIASVKMQNKIARTPRIRRCPSLLNVIP